MKRRTAAWCLLVLNEHIRRLTLSNNATDSRDNQLFAVPTILSYCSFDGECGMLFSCTIARFTVKSARKILPPKLSASYTRRVLLLAQPGNLLGI